MDAEKRITAIEEELKILKNEIKSVLLDVREHYLNMQNPFNPALEVPERPTAGKTSSDSKTEVTIIQEASPQARAQEADPGKNSTTDAASNPQATHGPHQENEQFDEDDGVPTMGLDTDFDVRDSESRLPFSSADYTRKKKKGRDHSSSNDKIDLVVIAALTQWVDQATTSLGKERAEALIEMSYAMRHMPGEVKDVLVKLARLAPNDVKNGKEIKAKDYLSALAQLENLLGGGHREDALLSILSMMSESTNG